MSDTLYLSAADTARLIRASLKEAFPGVKFSVRSSTYSGGASASIRWTDGPNEAQVEAVTDRYRGSYFDSSIDYRGSVHHMETTPDGFRKVSMGVDFIHTNRDHSDAAVQRAIDAVYRRFQGNFERDGIARPTVEDYRNGALWNVRLSGLHDWNGRSLSHDVNMVLHKHSFVFKLEPSKTAGRYFVTHDDGYSMMCGSGHTVAPRD
ncbi:LPD29 domain-containing protein [Burkholderia vietnamiensis]|uniref:LPD29 domain-containing protein n=1 Tax=Burkholderia vietnamiensis TaxID=60552 RepID=UPI00158CD17B|nr:LPD29 domain-containing protein [Burkholderia vietnamiensis]